MSVVDHIIIAVQDLDQASQDYALMLGHAPSWRGTHPGYGSANTLFRLDNCYLELLAATGEGWAGDMVRSVLEAQGQSLCALVFRIGGEPFDAVSSSCEEYYLPVVVQNKTGRKWNASSLPGQRVYVYAGAG